MEGERNRQRGATGLWVVVTFVLMLAAFGAGMWFAEWRLAGCEHRIERLERLVAGHATPAYLGVRSRDFTAELAAATDLPELRGALVREVLADSPASAMGLRPGDVVVQVADRPVRRAADLAAAVAPLEPGSPLLVELVRDGEVRRLHGTVAARPEAVEP